jgi:hypothetical protein
LPEERHTYSREYFQDMICTAMGGRVAEMIVFGHLNSGAANDLEQATSIARRMVREWGMSDAVGPMAWSGQQQVFLGEDLMTSGREYSDETARMIDSEIGLILREQENRAKVLIEKNRSGLDLVAQALLEVIAYDPDGNPITSNLADYGFISAAELPSFERVPMETPTPRNPLGAKGIGEAGTIGATPAVHNAVVNAVSHLGVTHIDMPCTSFNVWTAIQAVR